MYDKGKGIQQDYKEAFKWYKKAAEQRYNADAQSMLGLMYEIGLGVQHDYKEAISWYKKAEETRDILSRAIDMKMGSITQEP